jgi:hypothetical protein
MQTMFYLFLKYFIFFIIICAIISFYFMVNGCKCTYNIYMYIYVQTIHVQCILTTNNCKAQKFLLLLYVCFLASCRHYSHGIMTIGIFARWAALHSGLMAHWLFTISPYLTNLWVHHKHVWIIFMHMRVEWMWIWKVSLECNG